MEAVIVQKIVESMPIGLLVIDPQGRITVTNSALCAILGYEARDLLREGWGELFIQDDRNLEFNQVFVDVVLGKAAELKRSVPYQDPGGRMLQLSVSSSYLKLGDTLVGIILLIEDITEKHLLHARESRMISALQQLQRERAEGLSQLALSVAHQIRNPMIAIGGFAARLFRNTQHDDSARESLEIIVSELRKLENIVRVVTQYSSLPPVSLQTIELRPMFDRSLEKLAADARARGVDVRADVACPQGLVVQGDAGSFPLVVEALLGNALDAVETGMPLAVRISVAQDASDTRIVVADDGPGIAEGDLPFVFDPFFTTKAQAVGMGLALAKRIVLDHRGELGVRNVPGRGAEFAIRLPRSWWGSV